MGRPPAKSSLATQRPWFPSEQEELERLAVEILEKHDFPTVIEFPPIACWAWTGCDLYWTSSTWSDVAVVGDIDKRGWRLLQWDACRALPTYRKLWPERSPFDWAEHVHRFHLARVWAEEHTESFRQAWEAGFELGTYLGEINGRDVRSRAAAYGGTTKKSPTRDALALAQAIQDSELLSQRELIKRLEAALAAGEIKHLPVDRNEMVRNWLRRRLFRVADPTS